MSSVTPGSRHMRKTLIGFVTSRSGDKSIKVTIPYKTPHPLYHKVINRKTVVHVHDGKNETKVGDRVKIMETRPLSRLKRWRIVAVIESSAGLVPEAISEADVAAQVPTKAAQPASPAETSAFAKASADKSSAKDTADKASASAEAQPDAPQV